MRNLFICVFLSLVVMISGCQPTAENTEIVVSDAITSNGGPAEPEIAPNAVVYKIEKKDKQSVLKYLFAKKLSGMQVQFYARPSGSGDDWTKLGDGPVTTDSEGRASLDGLRKWLTVFDLGAAPLDFQLRADVIFSDGSTVTDDMGLIRVLGSILDSDAVNPKAVIADHDNTLHATGGLNSIADAVNFLNFAKSEWPLVDEYVVPSVKSLLADGKDFIIVTGMVRECRALCRKQMINHFEASSLRTIPIFLKDDFSYDDTSEYKAACLGIIKRLYSGDGGDGKVLAMVGDTPHDDGYGSIANGIFYIPFKVNYFVNPMKALDTEGYGYITPDSIAWDWSQVMDMIATGDTVSNIMLRNDTGFLNIAHRGGAALMPENTLEAFRNGMAEGADGYELDLQVTKDGYIVISHDTEVDRCTDGTGSINDMTIAEVKALDAGYYFTMDGGATYPYRGTGIGIPTLEEVLNEPVLKDAPGVIEIKQLDAGVSGKLLDMIEAHGIKNHVIIESFDQDALDDVRNEIALRGDDVITSFSQSEIISFFLTPLSVMIATKYEPPAKVLQVPVTFSLNNLDVTVINDTFMLKARYLGLKVHAWTINDADEMRSLMSGKKVEAIMTDQPGILHSVVNE